MEKPIKTGAVCFIVAIAVGILFSIINSVFGTFIISIISSVISSVLFLFFYYAIIVLGKRTGSSLIAKSGKWLFVLAVIGVIMSIFLMIFGNHILSSNPALLALSKGNVEDIQNIPGLDISADATPEEAYSYLLGKVLAENKAMVFSLLGVYSIFIILFVVLEFMLAAGLIKIKKELPIAKATGILLILTLCAFLIGVILLLIGVIGLVSSMMVLGVVFLGIGLLLIFAGGLLVLAFVVLLEILLFMASNKYETGKAGKSNTAKPVKQAKRSRKIRKR